MHRLKSKKVQSTILMGILFLMINGILLYYVGIPQLKSIDLEVNKNDEKLMSLELMITNEKIIAKKMEDLVLLRSELQFFDQQVPDYFDTPEIVYEFYTYTNSMNMTPILLRFSQPEFQSSDSKDNENTDGEENQNEQVDQKEQGILNVFLDFTAQGNMNQMSEFLKNLSKISVLEMAIQNLRISPIDDNQMEVQIIFKQYIQSAGLRDFSYEEYAFSVDRDGFDNLADLFSKQVIERIDVPIEVEPIEGELAPIIGEEIAP